MNNDRLISEVIDRLKIRHRMYSRLCATAEGEQMRYYLGRKDQARETLDDLNALDAPVVEPESLNCPRCGAMAEKLIDLDARGEVWTGEGEPTESVCVTCLTAPEVQP
jgi:hypothetical protein